MGIHAPGVKDNAASVLAAHNLMLSHGEAVRALRQVVGKDAQLGITLNFSPAYPATDSAEDAAAACKADGFSNRWFLDPIFKGKYSADLLEGWGDLAKKLEMADLTTMSVPIDFLGVNYYTRQVVRHDPQAQGGVAHLHPEGEYTEMDWEVFPQGLTDLLTRLQRDYDPAALYVTENGAAFKDVLEPRKQVRDERRIAYLQAHFAAAYRAIQDGVKLRGYYVWSLMDNFEWALGYTKRFGIVYVDYQKQERIPKASARWYHGVIQENGLKA